ncbi:MAG: DnaA/Hda family protein, partial [Gemmatimonadota bacterium]|nr:DnaA/Hda family protein [Gemmatimonadota bacterium]
MLSAQERTAQEIWLLILKNLESRMSEQTISTWFISSHAVSMTGENLTIELKNRFIAQYVEQSYQNTLNQVATKALGRPFKINLIYRQRHEQIDLWDQENVAKYSVSSLVEQQEPVDTAPEPSTHKKKPGSKKRTAPGKKRAPLKGTLNPRYTFKNFVVGSNSRLAHAAALSVSNAPAISYNPLFIYGGVGLGKTHLMQAIGRELLDSSKFGKLEIGYLTT